MVESENFISHGSKQEKNICAGKLPFLKPSAHRAWWLTPVMLALLEARRVDHLRSGVQDQPDQHGKTLSLPKNTNISWVWGPVPISEVGESLELRRQRL